MRFNPIAHTINEIHVSTKEWQIMSFFRENQGKELTKNEITAAVWGTDKPQTNVLAVLIKAIRTKLPVKIETVYGVGYRYQGEDYQKSNPFCEGDANEEPDH